MAKEVIMAQLAERTATKEELRALTERVARVEGIVEQMSDLTHSLASDEPLLLKGIPLKGERVRHRLNHMDTRLTWIWVTQITMWVTIILTILPKG